MSGCLSFFNETYKYNHHHKDYAKFREDMAAKGIEISKEIKPIMGFEAYVVDDRTKRVKGEANRHLVLLAKNQQGFKNLLKLHYEGYATGATKVFSTIKPRLDHTLLVRENCEGIIATSACLIGEIPRLLNQGKEQEAIQLIEKYKQVFDEFYLEVQPTEFIDKEGTEQANMNAKIMLIAEATDTPVVVTTDSHYINEDDADTHKLLLAIQSKQAITDEKCFSFEATPLMTTDYMIKHFGEEIVANTQKIADACESPDFLLRASDDYRLPKFPIPEDKEFECWKEKDTQTESENEAYRYCSYLINKNWYNKLRHLKKNKKLDEEYKERLKMELEIIKDMGFIDYFLIVQDFITWCKSVGITTGTGRGSAGGCLLSCILGITKLDPMKYNLLFSRFLNKDRISLPDIDIDIDKLRRDEVKEYLANKYGRDRVASIATFSRMKVRACIKDIVRSLNIGGSKGASFKLADAINKTLENESDDITFLEAMDINDFKDFMDDYKDIGKYAQAFEGIIRQTGIHAAGTIIGAEPLTDTIPLMVDKKGVVATAYDGVTLEKDGFLKMDLLGLKNLSIINDAIINIKKVRDEELKGIPMNGVEVSIGESEQEWAQKISTQSKSVQMASKAFKLLREGRTNAVFQVEGSGMKGLLKGIYVNNIEEVSAVLALNRPGPLKTGLTAEYGKRKLTGEDLDEWYLHKSLKPILKNTYGIIAYQEQCMQIAMHCAGFSESEADTLRKAMGKKISELMDKYHKPFINGYIKKHGVTESVAQKVWDAVSFFAEYGFNKSHSVGYAHTTYQTAFLKANYPAEYWGAVLSNEAEQSKLTIYLREAANSGIKILPVDINKSTMTYEVEDEQTIRRDLASLKGVGATAIDEILKNRPFKNMVDFLSRNDTKRVKSTAIEALIKAGAFDNAFKDEKYCRKIYFDYYKDCRTKIKRHVKRYDTVEECEHNEKIIEKFKYDWSNPINIKTRKDKTQPDGIKTIITDVPRQSKDPKERWSNSEVVGFEYDIYGMSVTYNVFDFYRDVEQRFQNFYGAQILQLAESLDGYQHDDIIYMMVLVKEKTRETVYGKDKDKEKKRYRRVYSVEDRTDEGELIVFEKNYQVDKKAWSKGSMLILECQVNLFNNRKSIVLKKVLKNYGKLDGRI